MFLRISALKLRLWVIVRTTSSVQFLRVLTICVLSINMKKILILSENFHFLVVKFSVYLNRYVFVMDEIK